MALQMKMRHFNQAGYYLGASCHNKEILEAPTLTTINTQKHRKFETHSVQTCVPTICARKSSFAKIAGPRPDKIRGR